MLRVVVVTHFVHEVISLSKIFHSYPQTLLFLGLSSAYHVSTVI